MISFILFSLIIYVFLSSPTLIINSVNESINLFIKNILPTLLPFFILTDILNNYNYFDYIKRFLKLKYSDIVLISIISGLPSNAKSINDLLNKNKISINDASRMLSITYFPNPMFVIGTIGALMLNNTRIGFILLSTTYLSNFIVYFINYKHLNKNNVSTISNKLSFSMLLKNSILNNTSSLLVILGTIIIFNLIIKITNTYININSIFLSIINIILELTSGINSIINLNISFNIKCILLGLSLSLSGLSVIFQSISILNNYKLNFKILFTNKLLIIIINLILNIIVFNIIKI